MDGSTVLGLLLAGWAALNAWMTWRVLRARSDYLPSKKLLIAGIWIAPIVGALTARSQLRAYAPETPTAPRTSPRTSPVDADPAPERIAMPGVETLDLAQHMGVVHGFPLIDWSAVQQWLAAFEGAPEQRQQAMSSVRRAWLLHLRDALGPEYFHLHESQDAYVLSSLEPNVVNATARFVSKARQRVATTLQGLCAFPAGEKSILIVFDDEDTYYAYVSAYYSDDGEFAMSGGMFINAGCPHFVTRRADLAQIEPVIAHELTHSAVSHLQLPLWLDEGIAVNTERRVAGVQPSLYTPQQLQAMHLRFWGTPEIQQFWSGASFHRPDDGNLLSYDLARIIVEALGKDWAAFESFVSNAQRADAGVSSAREHLGVDLVAYVCALLQREPDAAWAPRVEQPEGEAALAATPLGRGR